MDLKKDYKKLYQQWHEEFKQIKLTELNQDLFNHYKKILNFINEYKEDNSNELKNLILNSYKENFNFLFDDFLKLREDKIINSALALKEINLNNVIEAEKLFYQNLVGTIKGFKKVKTLSLYEGESEINLEDLIKSEVKIKEDIKEVSISNKKENSLISESNDLIDEVKIDYTLVRFLKETPPLVGIDLINYGPFEKEDIANLPKKNANILMNEKFAEKIELN
ncbi:MAG: hypothetical protein KAW03_02665 [Candidatus Lokiarchaeota archaeon]|nr:hypothetical protein [Candidatus Lokiarchaeota archaeon]